jgi:hypothetical protein
MHNMHTPDYPELAGDIANKKRYRAARRKVRRKSLGDILARFFRMKRR